MNKPGQEDKQGELLTSFSLSLLLSLLSWIRRRQEIIFGVVEDKYPRAYARSILQQ